MFLYTILILAQLLFEAMPISSSGHFLLLNLIINSYGSCLDNVALPEFFDHFLHGGAALVVLFLFFKDWTRPFVCLLSTCGILGKKNINRARNLFFIFFKIVGLVIVSDFITTIFYFFYHSFLNKIVLHSPGKFLFLGFVITMFSLFSLIFKERTFFSHDSFNLKKALVLGVVQSITLFPGISRFALTYVASRWLNLSIRRAFQISFLIQFPLNIASFFKGGWHLLKVSTPYPIFNWEVNLALFFGTVASFFLLMFARWIAFRQRMWIFGLYLLLPIFFLFVHLLLS